MEESAHKTRPHKEPRHPLEEHMAYSDVKTLLSWSAPGRPFRKKKREYYLSIALLVALFEIILFLFSEYQLMLAVGALAFLSVALSSVPPRDFHYKISTEGIKIEDHFYIWSELYDFYFKHIDGIETLMVTTQALIPGELRIPIEGMDRDHVRRIMVAFLPYREVVKPTFMERSGDWLSRTFPLERKHS